MAFMKWPQNISHIQQKVFNYFFFFSPTVLQSSHLFFGTYIELNDNLITKSAALFWVFGRTPQGT